MEPGRELDLVVAEKVMGCSLEKGASPIGIPHITCGCPGYPHRDFTKFAPSIKPFSTDIASAWDVAQRIADLDEDNQFVIHVSPAKHQECEVEIKFWDYSEDPADPVLAGPIFILGKTAPHAICLAALKAVGA